MRPAEVVAVLNAEGTVVTQRQLKRHREAAGFRVAPANDPQRVHLMRYVAWTVAERHARMAEQGDSAEDQYAAQMARARERGRKMSRAGRSVGPLPDVADPDRRAACATDLRLFCETYFPATFHMAWSQDHLKVLAKIEKAVLEGGLFAMAMPRGSGKSSICEAACTWAELNGHRRYVAMIGPDEPLAANMLESMKSEIENNDMLLGDFPEACFFIRALDGIHQRASGQLYESEQTRIAWTEKEIVLPTVRPSEEWLAVEGNARFVAPSGYTLSSGAIVQVAGITGRIRGMKHKRSDGESVRPELVLVDDPQTDESARSPSQCASRERILAGAVLGLAGPGRKIAGLMTLTVVRPNDLADRMLDPDKHPAWQGERTKMVYAFPTNESAWERYAELRADGLRGGWGLTEATAYYQEHRAEMDAGAEVAWAERFNHDEASAIQHAMNLRFQDEAAFFAEYQNDPLPDIPEDSELPTTDEICERTNGHDAGLVPLPATRLTMFVDVQLNCLFWIVCAWEDNFTGYVIDYGTEPDQKLQPGQFFTLRDARRTLRAMAPNGGFEAAIYSGLERLMDRTVGREWKRDGGSTARVDRCVIDANWGVSTDLVYQFCRQSAYAGTLTPGHGRYVGASSVPFGEYRRKRGEQVGLNWRVPVPTGRRAVRHVLYDTNWWKSFLFARLNTPVGDPGALTLYGRRPAAHALLAEHLVSEQKVKVTAKGRTVDEWRLKQPGLDNHWLDGAVGCAVAASMSGSVLFGTDQRRGGARKKIKLSELQGRR